MVVWLLVQLVFAGAATIAATIAAARVRVIPGGHTLFFDRADFVNPLILSFLDQREP